MTISEIAVGAGVAFFLGFVLSVNWPMVFAVWRTSRVIRRMRKGE